MIREEFKPSCLFLDWEDMAKVVGSNGYESTATDDENLDSGFSKLHELVKKCSQGDENILHDALVNGDEESASINLDGIRFNFSKKAKGKAIECKLVSAEILDKDNTALLIVSEYENYTLAKFGLLSKNYTVYLEEEQAEEPVQEEGNGVTFNEETDELIIERWTQKSSSKLHVKNPEAVKGVVINECTLINTLPLEPIKRAFPKIEKVYIHNLSSAVELNFDEVDADAFPKKLWIGSTSAQRVVCNRTKFNMGEVEVAKSMISSDEQLSAQSKGISIIGGVKEAYQLVVKEYKGRVLHVQVDENKRLHEKTVVENLFGMKFYDKRRNVTGRFGIPSGEKDERGVEVYKFKKTIGRNEFAEADGIATVDFLLYDEVDDIVESVKLLRD